MFLVDIKNFFSKSRKIIKIGVPDGHDFSTTRSIILCSEQDSIDIRSDIVTPDGWCEVADFYANKKNDQEYLFRFFEVNFLVDKLILYYFLENGVMGFCSMEMRSRKDDYIIISGDVIPEALTIKSNILRSKYNAAIPYNDPDLNKMILI